MTFESLGVAGLFVSAFISATIAPGGSEAVLAYLLNQPQPNVTHLLLAATIGNTLGGLTTWWLGLYAAQKYPADALIKPIQQKSLATVRKFGIFALLFSWVPVIGDALCFAGGWLKLSFTGSLLAILTGKFCRYLAVVYVFI